MQAESTRTAGRISELKPTAINTILVEVRALRAQGREVVSLMRGEPDFPTPEHVAQAAQASLSKGRTSYPENRGEPSLREAVALKMQRDNGLVYDPGSEVLVTDGATLGIYAALMSMFGPGDDILIPDPIYDAYASPIRLAGARPSRVRSSRGRGGRFEIHVDALEAAWTPATRGLLLNDPWNPVGTVFTHSELAQIAEFVLRHDLVVISDEIYEAITYDGHQHMSPAALSPEMRSRCIIVNSLSKTYAMTGWRLGYCAAPERFIRPMFLVLQQSSRGPAMFVQDAGVAALTGPQDCVMRMRESYTVRRDAVTKALSGLRNVDVLAPEGGFFTMLDMARCGRPSEEVRRHLLHNCNVAVVHGRAYGESGEGTLRVSFASGGDVLSRGLRLLREGLEAL